MAQNVVVPPFDVAPETVVGSTPQSVFAFDFPFWEADDLIVYIDGDALASSAFTVQGYNVQNGDPVEGGYGSGIVTLNTAVANCSVTIDRLVVASRESQFSRAAPLGMPSLNSDLNKLTARQQDLVRILARALLAPVGENVPSAQDVIDAAAAVAEKANRDFSNGTKIALPQGMNPSILHTLTGNPVTPTFANAVIVADTGLVNDREVALSVGMNSYDGVDNTDPVYGKGDKIAGYFGNVAYDGSFNVWALNTLTEVSSGAATCQGAWSAEIDFNNNRAHSRDTPGASGYHVPASAAAPFYRGLDITGGSNFRSAAAITIGHITPNGWNRGIVVDQCHQTAFCDYSSGTTTLGVEGTHTDIFDLTGATISGKILKSAHANMGAQGDLSLVGAFTGLMGLIQNTTDAATAQGLKVETRWATSTGRAFQVYVNGQEYFRVDGDPTNPVWVRVGGTLRNVIVDGSGFLKVV